MHNCVVTRLTSELSTKDIEFSLLCLFKKQQERAPIGTENGRRHQGTPRMAFLALLESL